MSADEPYKAFIGLSLQGVKELHAAVANMQVRLAFIMYALRSNSLKPSQTALTPGSTELQALPATAYACAFSASPCIC